jgi:hypothetical protein
MPKSSVNEESLNSIIELHCFTECKKYVDVIDGGTFQIKGKNG